MLGVLLLWVVLAIVLEFIPVLGVLVVVVLSPALFGGYLSMCQTAVNGGEPELDQFFSGLTRPPSRLEAIVLGLLLLAAYVLVLIVCSLFFLMIALAVLGTVPWQTINELQMASPQDITISMGLLLVLLLTLLMAMLLYTLLALAFTYASPLVVQGRATAFAALRLSLRGCMANILPLGLFGLLYLLLFVVALVPLGLGLLVFLPVSMAALAASYTEIYPDWAADVTRPA